MFLHLKFSQECLDETAIRWAAVVDVRPIATNAFTIWCVMRIMFRRAKNVLRLNKFNYICNMKNILLAFALVTMIVSCKEKEEAPVQLPEVINSPNNMSDTANKKTDMYLKADSVLNQK